MAVGFIHRWARGDLLELAREHLQAVIDGDPPSRESTQDLIAAIERYQRP